MPKTKHFIAVTLVATALCADRLALAIPTAPPVAQLAGRLIQRLSGGFRQQLPSTRLFQPIRTTQRPSIACPVPNVVAAIPAMVRLSPFYFRLPPPLA